MKWFGAFIFGFCTAAVSDPVVALIPTTVSPGEVTLVRLSPALNLTLHAGATDIPLWECPAHKNSRCGLVSVPMEARLALPIQVKWNEGAEPREHTISLALVEKKYPRTQLKVAAAKVNPSAEEQKRIDLDGKEFAEIYSASLPAIQWQQGFQLPTAGRVTSAFGSQRVFNGQVEKVHYGVDLRAGPKDPIFSANAGKIVFARESFYGGKTVIIDHGLGIFSSYGHLSSLDVAAGQEIKRGVFLGRAGSTGRVTGPHLHWSVKVNGLAVDPLQMRRVFARMWDAEPDLALPTVANSATALSARIPRKGSLRNPRVRP